MTKIGRFHDPYMPNDGHGPGVPLPDRLHRWLCTLSGGYWSVEGVIESVPLMTDDEPLKYSGNDYGDYIGIYAFDSHDSPTRHHWMGIKYDEVKDDEDHKELG